MVSAAALIATVATIDAIAISSRRDVCHLRVRHLSASLSGATGRGVVCLRAS